MEVKQITEARRGQERELKIARAEEPKPEPKLELRSRGRAESQKAESFRSRDKMVSKPIVFCVNEWS